MLCVSAGWVVVSGMDDQGTPAGWFKGNTHTHTLNSDGDSTPDEVVRWYREHGYQFLVLTDHNFLTSVDGLNALHGASDRFLVIQRRGGHRSIRGQADPRQRPRGRRAGRAAGRIVGRRRDSAERERDPRRAGRAARQPSELRVGDHRRRAAAGREHEALRDLQRPSAGEQRWRRRRAGPGAGLGHHPHERPPDLRHRRRRRAHVQGSGQSGRWPVPGAAG